MTYSLSNRIPSLSTALVACCATAVLAGGKPSPPEFHTIQLTTPTGTYADSFPVQSDTAIVADDESYGQVPSPCGSVVLQTRRGLVWDLNGAGQGTSSVSPTVLPLPPAADGIQDAFVTGISSGGGYISGSGFAYWDLSTCSWAPRGFIWVQGGGSWNIELVESCDAAGTRLGRNWSAGSRVNGVNDNGLAVGVCREAGGDNVPVTWTRVGLGVWVLSVLPMGSFAEGEARGVASGSGSTTDLVSGKSINPTTPIVWHCATDCGLEELPTGAYATGAPNSPDEFGDVAGSVGPGPYAAVWSYDAATASWSLEVLASGDALACDRIGGASGDLQAVGHQHDRRGTSAMRWTRRGSSWTGQKLQDLDDTSLSLDKAFSLDEDGRITAHGYQRSSDGRYVLIPFSLLAP